MAESIPFIWKGLSGAFYRFSALDSPFGASSSPSNVHRATPRRQPHLQQVAGSPEPHEPDPPPLAGAPDRNV